MEKAHLPESRALEALIDSYSISVINGVTYEQLTRRCQSIPTPSELFAEPTIATQTKNGVNFAFEKVREFGETARASSHLNEYESQARELDQLDQLGVKGGDQESAISKFAEVLTLEEATEEMRRRIEEQRTDLELEPGDTWL